MKLVPIDRWADAGPGFNRPAAEAVYKAMTGMDDGAALVYGRILVADSLHYDLIAHREELVKAARHEVRARAEALQVHYSRAAVAKARRGEDNTVELGVLVEIGKAFDFSAEQRRAWAAERTRSDGGRFAAEHRKIETDDRRGALHPEHAEKALGVPKNTKLTDKDLAHYQQAYSQIRDMVAPYHEPDLNALLHLDVQNGRNLREEVVPVGTTGKPTEFGHKLNERDRIQTARVTVHPNPRSAVSGTFDVMAALGGPRFGGQTTTAVGHGILNPDRLAQYNKERQTVTDNENYSAAARTFSRLEHGSNILRDSLGPAAPPKLQYALAIANHVGRYGPEAQKVIGPAADRAAYRYRGTERAPDPELINAFDRFRVAGLRGNAARQLAIYGKEPSPGRVGRDPWNPMPVLNYFRGQLPDADLNELQRRSGVIPPSEGIIIDRRGKVTHQAIGYADDWYLPFNLQHLSALNGGEYIRTRTFGGPTTEDIYTGLITNARHMTVVSHSGVYTVDFDRAFRGGRRFNDKAARMVARYGQLLDAVRSAQVSQGGISTSRMAELRQLAHDHEPNEASPVFRQRFDELKAAERQNPTLSRAESDQAAAEWLGAYAADLPTNGRVLTSADAVNEIVEAQARRTYTADRAQREQYGRDSGQPPLPEVYTLDDRREQARRDLQAGTVTESVARVAAAMNPPQTGSLERYMKKASDANAGRARALRLDGNGYFAALKALKEQFPYYIDKVHYHEWKDSMGVGDKRTLERARDTGYVAPRFNRPQDVEAGYFNPDVTGAGKVQAQDIRYQNYRHRKGVIRPAGNGRGAFDADDTAAPAPGTVAPAAAPSAAAPADQRRAADLAMLKEVTDQTHFADGAAFNVRGFKVAFDSGTDIRREVKRADFPADEPGSAPEVLKQVFTRTPAELEALPPDELHDLMSKLSAHTVGPEKLFATVKPETVQSMRNEGKPVPLTAPPTDLPGMLAGRGKNFTFGGIAYDPTRPTDTGTVERVYGGEQTVRELVDAGRLPAVSDPGFDTAASALETELRDAHAEHSRRRSVGDRPDPSEERRLVRNGEGLLRADLLRRRWVEANANTRPAPAPAPASPNSTTLEFHLPKDASREDMDRLRDILLTPLPEDDPRNTIGR